MNREKIPRLAAKAASPGALTLGSFENGARFAWLRPGAAYIEVLQLLERVVRAEFAVDEAMYNAPIPTVILNVAARASSIFDSISPLPFCRRRSAHGDAQRPLTKKIAHF